MISRNKKLLPSFIESNFVVAQGDTSFLGWVMHSMSLTGWIALLLSTAVFLAALWIGIREHRPKVIAALLVFVPIPVMVSIFGAVKGSIASFAVVAQGGVEIPQEIIFQVLAEQLIGIFSTLLFTIPAYAILAIALFVRVLKSNPK